MKKKSAAPKSRHSVRSSALQAESLRLTRCEHATEIAEDYVEAIADLAASVGEARLVDLAHRLGVTHVTVNRTLNRLQRAGYVKTEPYRAIFLTRAGRKLAADSKCRHEIVVMFLRSLGISARVAEIDAEGIEHHVSAETLSALKRALARRGAPRSPPAIKRAQG